MHILLDMHSDAANQLNFTGNREIARRPLSIHVTQPVDRVGTGVRMGKPVAQILPHAVIVAVLHQRRDVAALVAPDLVFSDGHHGFHELSLCFRLSLPVAAEAANEGHGPFDLGSRSFAPARLT